MTRLSPRVVPWYLTAMIVLAACGGDSATPSTPPTQPPPPLPQVATTVVAQSGDAQQAESGSALPARPTVLVRDAAGLPMSGVSVAFRVDSGGGALAATSATTSSDGTASAGIWTLGTGLGANVVSATVAGLPPVRFRALAVLAAKRTLIDTQTVAASGGVLRYTKTGDPLDGLTVTIRTRSFANATRWTIRADSSIVVPLPADFVQVGPVLVITNGEGYADSTMTLTTPMRIAASDAVAPFYFDSATRSLEAISLVERTDSSATLATRHFSGDMLALPRNAATGALRASRGAGFGTVNIVWVRTPKAKLVGTFLSTFQPGVDDWEFTNYGDYITPSGICEGMSITAMYYHYFMRAAGQPPLYHRYDKSIPNLWDNVQGIRFAGSVQRDYLDRFDSGINQFAALANQGIARGTKTEDLTSAWILLTLKLTQNPVLLALRLNNGGHTVVAFGASSTGTQSTVLFSDPNFPGTIRSALFTSGVLTPVSMQINASQPGSLYNKAYALGVSGEIPITQITQRWREFTQQKAGTDRYPASYSFERYNLLAGAWELLTDTVRTTDPELQVRFMCPGCPTKAVGAAPDQQVSFLWNAAGSTDLGVNVILNTAGTRQLLAVGTAFADFDLFSDGRAGFVDAKPFTVIAREFKIAATQLTAPPGVDLDFAALPAGIGGSSPRFRWDFGDNSAAVTKVGDSTVSHQWTRPGKFTVQVELRDGAGTLVARASSAVEIGNTASFVWAFESATVLNSSLPAGGIGSTRTDTLIFMRASAWIASLRAVPFDHGILIFGRPSGGAKCNATAILESFVPGAGPADTTRGVNGFQGIIGSCGDPDYSGSLTLGSLVNGTLIGSATPTPNPNVIVLPGGSISATNAISGASDGVLTGTFTVNYRYSTGIGTYTVAFSASLFKPNDPAPRAPTSPVTAAPKRRPQTVLQPSRGRPRDR